MNPVLHIDAIEKVYRKSKRSPVHALQSASLSLQPGDLEFVCGPSGSGKSTLLLCAGGLLKPDSGSVKVCGTDLYAMDSGQRAAFRASHLGFVFQQFHLIPYLGVLDNILVPLLATGDAKWRRRAEELMEQFGLADRSDHPPSELSIGERQRVALARALLCQPRLILADEPTGNLDPENGDRVMKALSTFAREGGAVLIVTHEHGRVSKPAWRISQGILQAPDSP